MTIRELYEWAEQNNALDYNIEIQYRDDGGLYMGREELEEPYPYIDKKTEKTVVCCIDIPCVCGKTQDVFGKITNLKDGSSKIRSFFFAVFCSRNQYMR